MNYRFREWMIVTDERSVSAMCRGQYIIVTNSQQRRAGIHQVATLSVVLLCHAASDSRQDYAAGKLFTRRRQKPPVSASVASLPTRAA